MFKTNGYTCDVNTKFSINVKTKYLGMESFNLELFDKNQVKTTNFTTEVEDYIIYLDTQNPTQDYEAGVYEIDINDAGNYVIGEYVRIKNTAYKIIGKDDNSLNFETALTDDITTEDEVKLIKLQEMIGLYKVSFIPNKVGNFDMLITNRAYNISVFEKIDVITPESTSESTDTGSTI